MRRCPAVGSFESMNIFFNFYVLYNFLRWFQYLTITMREVL